MPKSPINYKNCIIYKLVCKDLDISNIYIGSTTNFRRRKNQHKECCSNLNSKKYNELKYRFIRENGGFENWEMIEIEKYPCNDSNEALARERYWIENLNSQMNKIIPQRTKSEYREANKDPIKLHNKVYYDINREKIIKQNKEYIKNNKESIKQYQSQYRENNKEHLQQYQSQYRENNKEHLQQYQKDICICECGKTYTKGHKQRHLKSTYHMKHIII